MTISLSGILALAAIFLIGISGLVGMVQSDGFWEFLFCLFVFVAGLIGFGFTIHHQRRNI